MKRLIGVLLAVLLTCGMSLAQRDPRPLELAEGQENLALGKPCLFSAVPSYRLTHNETDLQDLTDGLLTWRQDDKIWFDANACAWYGDPYVNIQLDLGEVRPVSEVGIRLLGGAEQGGLKFPAEVVVLLSDGAENWREVGRYRKPPEGEDPDDPFGVPPEEGVAYTHPLRFADLRAAGRYVGFKITGQTSFVASDELWVLAGDHSVADATAGEPFDGEFIVHNFTPDGLTAYFNKSRVYACSNLQAFQTLHGLDNRPEETNKSPVEVLLDLPDGVTLRRFMLNPRFGGAVTDDFETEQVMDGDRTFTRYHIPTRGIWIKYWGYLFLQTTWDDGQTGPLRLGCRWEEAAQEPEEYTIESVHIEPVEPPEKLHVSIAWMNHSFWMKWPDFVDSYKACGFSAVPVFPRYAKGDDQDYLDAVAACRGAGLDIVNNSSPIHAIKGQMKEHPEVACQLPDGPARFLCPSYRGELWQEEVERVAERYSWTKGEWMFYDCEAFSSWRGGNEDAKQCSRCQKAYEGFDGAWDDFIASRGADFYRAVHARIAELAPDASFQAGAYGVQPSRFYHDIWKWEVLYPDLHQFAMPSLYSFRPAPVGDAIRENRALMARSDLIPWVQPGNQGEMPASHLYAIVLEVLLSGGRGLTYYTQSGFDAADLRAVAEAVAALRPVEDIIIEGKLLEGTECDREGVRLGGVRSADQGVLLVSEYETPGAVECRAELPGDLTGPVAELTPGGQEPVEAVGGAITVTLDDTRARAYLLSAK